MSDSPPRSGRTHHGPVPFAKGHGTENDFVIVPDPDGLLDISPQLVRALCDRRAGIGADGLLRVVRTSRIPDGLGLDGEWFMDYRNGDGSIAEMCGNGSRVFARYLVEAGLARPGTMRIATRAGTKLVVVPDEHSDITVDMGPAVFGTEAVVEVGGRPLAGIAVSMGNPHLVCGTVLPVADIDLSSAPEFDHESFPTGVNVEVVNVLAGDPRATPGVPAPEGYDLAVRMRVYERGSGETRSCGTGACAVAAVALRSAGRSTGRVAVDVPGGRVSVTVTTATTLLEGPAVLVGAGRLAPEWVAEITGGGIPATPPSMVVQAEQGRPVDDDVPSGPGRHGATAPRYAPADPADVPSAADRSRPAPGAARPTSGPPSTAPRPAPAPPAAEPRFTPEPPTSTPPPHQPHPAPAAGPHPSGPPASGPRPTSAPPAVGPRPTSGPPAAGPRPSASPAAGPRPSALTASQPSPSGPPASGPRPNTAPPAAGPRPSGASAAGPHPGSVSPGAPRPGSGPSAGAPWAAPAPPSGAERAAAPRAAAAEWLASTRPGATERLISLPPPAAPPGAAERLISAPPGATERAPERAGERTPADAADGRPAADERPDPRPKDRAAHLRAVADEAAHRAVQQAATVGPRA